MPRLLASVALVSLWLAFLVMGWSAGGAVYLLLVAGVALFPWRVLRASADAPPLE